MKNLDVISKRVLVAGLAAAAVLLSASLFVFSVSPSKAGGSEASVFSLPNVPDAEGGRYMMTPYQEVINDASGSYVRSENNILVWDKTTGKSIIYSYYNHTENGWGWHKLKNQLPADPLK